MEIEETQYDSKETFREKLDRWLGPQRLWLHITLFVLTFITTTLAGVEWRSANPFELTNFHLGIEYSLLLLLFLSSHEFGHFIAARIHGVDATLPYYIPFPGLFIGVSPNFGTFGAVIRTRSRVPSRSVMFDIGVAGPIAGFIVCLAILIVGFLTLPGIEYLQAIHPGYPNAHPAGTLELSFGSTILFSALRHLAPASAYVPPMTEVYHYPMLCVGWFGLFVTSLNLLPVGQLDGGHLMYGLLSPKNHRRVGQVTAIILLMLSLPEMLFDLQDVLHLTLPNWASMFVVQGGSTWFVWALIVSFVIKFRHPETLDESPMDSRRVAIGILTILIFVLCFTPSALVIK